VEQIWDHKHVRSPHISVINILNRKDSIYYFTKWANTVLGTATVLNMFRYLM